jgi:signal transduction histidine kinase/ligand-binding sensor domain-containing protein
VSRLAGARLRLWTSVLLWAALLLVCGRARALDVDIELAQVSHRSWAALDFAPTQVTGFTQAPDGRLWIASSAGLRSFDGVRFRLGGLYDSPFSTNLTAVLAIADDGLWTAFRSGGAAFIRLGAVKGLRNRDAFTAAVVHTLVRDPKGFVWLASDGGLFRLESSRWQRIGSERGVPDGPVLGAFIARNGTLWFATHDGVFSLAADGGHVAQASSEHLADNVPKYFAQAPDGAIWVSDPPQGVLRIVPDSSERPEWWFKGSTVGPMIFDRDGSLWMGGDRLRRMTAAQAARRTSEELSHADGLSGSAVLSVFEDSAGNIWVGTDRGVDRFRHADVVWVVNPHVGGDMAIVAGDRGRVWVADREGSLFAFDGAKWTKRLSGPRFTAALRGRDGSIWFGGPQGIARLADDDRLVITLPPPQARGFDVQAMAQDRAGSLWISFDQRGLFRLAGQRWTRDAIPALPREAPLTAMSDQSGNLWFGYTNNRLARVSGEAVRLFTSADGLDVGAVTALHAHASRLWVGGELGLGLFDGVRFTTVIPATCQPFVSISGVVETASNDLWVFRRGALSRIRQVDRELKQMRPDRRLECASYGTHETPTPTPQQLRPTPSLIEATDGRLLLAANEGLAWLDPARIRTESLVPPVVSIRNIVTNDGTYDPGPGLTLPVNTRDLLFTFDAVSPESPEGVRFRYRLKGVDKEWKSSVRGDVVYANLSPGTYRFEIAAGLWDTSNAGDPVSAEFVIPPAFYQTTWFHTLCALAGVLLLALFVRMQVLRANARLRARLEDRMRERERIARELHDTLLQGIQALVLRFQGVAARIPASEPARDLMERALELADDVISEGRERVHDLRDSGSAPADLPQELARVANELLQESSIRFEVTVHGTPRVLHPIVREEVFLIAREALANAHRHARPSAVEVNLFYDPSGLRVSIRDDGCGMDADVLRAGGREKHWGLLGMRERATRIRGQLEIWSRSEAGTEIGLRVPAAMAYRDASTRWGWLPFRSRPTAPLTP